MPLAGPIQLSKIYPNGLGRQNGEPGGGYRAAGAGEGKLGETPGPTAIYPRITQPAWPWISEESTYYRVALKFVSSSGSDSELRRSSINDLAAHDRSSDSLYRILDIVASRILE